MMIKNEELPLLADKLKPFIINFLTAATSAGAASGSIAVHDLDGSFHIGNLPWSRLDKTGSALADLATRPHSSLTGIGASDHHAPVTLASPSGLAMSGQQLSIDDNVAGDGLLIASKVLRVGGGDGINVLADLVEVYTPDLVSGNFGLTESANDIVVKFESNSGLDFGGTGGLTMGTPITVSPSSTNQVTGTQHSHAADASNNPGAAEKLLKSDSTGKLTLVRLDTPTIGSTAALDVVPTGNLYLGPDSNLALIKSSTNLRRDGYVSQLTGWAIDANGAGDFRYLYTDELHAKSFIADLEQALAGGQIICKSVAVLALDFTAPAASGTATLRVRDLPSAANMACFQSGDIVRLRTFSRSGGSLTIADCWGVVTAYTDQTDGTQTWTFTRSAAPNAGAMASGTVVSADAIVLDYGVSGNGFYEVNAIDGVYGANSPYSQIVRWTGHPATGQSVRLRTGNLNGVGGFGGKWGQLIFGSHVNQYVAATQDGLDLKNTSIIINDGTEDVVKINESQGIVIEVGSDLRRRLSFFDSAVEQGYMSVETHSGALALRHTVGSQNTTQSKYRLAIFATSNATAPFNHDNVIEVYGATALVHGHAHFDFNHITLRNAHAVPTINTPSLYVEAGALKYRGSSGTVTTIANA